MSAPQESRNYWKRDCGQSWGFVAANVEDPPQCVRQCRERFLKEVFPKDETFEQVCQLLTDKDHMDNEKPFRALYCCDSQLCGVDNLGGSGKDPNVNWFINACQDIGHHSIVDPGPPDSTYTCTLNSINEDDPRCKMDKSSASTRTADPSRPSPSTSNKILAEKLTTDHSTFVTSSTSTSHQKSMPTQASPGESDSSSVASQDSSKADEELDDDKGMSTGIKIAITVCTLLALISLLVFLLCFLRKRSRRQNRSNIRRRIKHPSSPRPPGSPTPLVSPTMSHTDIDGLPLTPPARLRERKFLPSVVSQLSPVSKTSSHRSFPASPLYSPTTSKLTPRHERTPKIYNGGHSPPVYLMVTTPPRGGVTAVAVANNRISPTRPSRPQEAAVDITGLASPGPPPTRALPSTPPNGPISPTISSPSTVRSGDVDFGIVKAPRNPNHNPVLIPESRSLYAVTEEDPRDSCNSWGSWSGQSVSKVGSLVSSPKRREVHSPLLR